MTDSHPPEHDPHLGRYRRQTRFAPLGTQGQRRLQASRVLVCGCGALGSVAAELLVRGGVGRVRIVDRDYLELDNLHRQVLFDESDVARRLPKAIAAANHLRQINSTAVIEPIVADVTHDGIQEIAAGVDCIVDGTDNFEIRYLLNDYALANDVPWVFGGCVGAEGQMLAVLPSETPCLACVMPEPPPVELQPNCETAGVIGPAVSVIAALEAAEAMKILSGNRKCVNRRMAVVDLWNGALRNVGVGEPHSACRACGKRDFAWLEGRRGGGAATLCGRNAVQLRPANGGETSPVKLAEKLKDLGAVISNDFLVRLEVDQYTLTVFANGRTIVTGTDDPGEARTVYAKYVGS